MHSAFVTLNGVPTRVGAWGRWIEESFPENEAKDVIIVIPGNPGLSKCYDEFLRCLHERLGWPVWVIGHAGHERPENESLYNIPSLNEYPELYNLNGQINHKIDFFEKYVPANARVHLMGHSVGAYIATKLMKHSSSNEKIAKTYLLFPTIEHIADTPNGKFFTNVLQRIVFFLLFLEWLFCLLHHRVQHFMVTVFVTLARIPKERIEMIVLFLDPVVLRRVIFMAKDEMRSLKERETEVIRANVGKIMAYFGADDGWAPISYCERLKADVPGIKAEVGQYQIQHSFCLRQSKEMAVVLIDWIIGSQ